MAKLDPGYKTVFLEPTTSTALQYSCKPLTITCCYYWRQREATILHPLPMVAGRCSTTNFKATYLVEIYICGIELMKTNGIAINAELLAFPNVCLEKIHSVAQWIMMSQNNLTIYIYIYIYIYVCVCVCVSER